MTGGIKICQVTRLTFVFLSCVLNVLANVSFVYVMAPGPKVGFFSLSGVCFTVVPQLEKFVRIVLFPGPFPRFCIDFWRLQKAYDRPMSDDMAYVKLFTSLHYCGSIYLIQIE